MKKTQKKNNKSVAIKMGKQKNWMTEDEQEPCPHNIIHCAYKKLHIEKTLNN